MIAPFLPIAQQVTLLRFPAQMTAREAEAVLTQFQWALRSKPTKIIFDCANTCFIDSSAIGLLSQCSKIAQARGIALSLWSVQPSIMEALEISGLPHQFQIEYSSDTFLSAYDRPLLNHIPLTHPSVQSRTKRSLDVVGAIVGLGITAALFVPIAIAIKLSGPGPVLFSQTRCGLMGRRFRIWKFRSMVSNAEQLKRSVQNESQGAFFKNASDPRITPVGRFLRKTSLDELPQFWNVLRGDMSLVGTRPPVPEEVEQYELLEWQRLNVKPGITGEWQVNGRSKIQDFRDVVHLDLRYQRRWSFAYDIKLVLKTFQVLFQKDAAV